MSPNPSREPSCLILRKCRRWALSPFPSPQTETNRNAARRLLEFYADLAGKTAVPEPKFERASIWFHVNTPLSKSDLLYAIETTFALNGFTIIAVDDHSIRLGFRAETLGNKGSGWSACRYAVVKERRCGYGHERRPGRSALVPGCSNVTTQ